MKRLTDLRNCSIQAVVLIACTLMSSAHVLAQAGIQVKLRSMINDSLLTKAQVGISVKNARTGTLVYEYNGNSAFTPASNLKLLTTATALSVLGPDYTYSTKLLYTGDVINGGFGGTLCIIGSGDPTLGSAKMPGVIRYQELIRSWVTKIKALGITQFEGRLLVNALKYEFNPIPKDYTWGDIGNYYGAGSYGININENQCVITLKPGVKIGGMTELVSVLPWDTSWSFVNHITTGPAGSGDKSIVYSSPYNSYVFAEGTIPSGNAFPVKGSIPDPAYLLAQLLITEMQQQGITWKGRFEVIKPGEDIQIQNECKILHEQFSPSVASIIKQTNTISNNLYAEALLKEIGSKKGLRPSTTIGSINYVKRYMKSIGIDTNGMVLRDGSGMSPFNCITPNQITQLLFKMESNKIFTSSLPVAGKEGTISHICKGTGEKIRLKSGTMNGTTCYSGYINGNSGTVYAVSFLVNKHEAKNKDIQRVLESGLLAIMME
ncbi:MAG: D-alanyl-D-alanine carboxypeptidase/D-alanyl-D-alanine-endopeptidase [Cytophagales bacterium]|nr:D-alanyl-D-alanine carboxypeptidase/D-alanyl-D-alanine-endopeptidase [Cytophaga sp.]